MCGEFVQLFSHCSAMLERVSLSRVGGIISSGTRSLCHCSVQLSRCLVRADTLLAIHEGEKDGDAWFAKSIEVRINTDKSITFLSSCKVDFPLPEGNKKGWEGAEYVDKGPEGEFLLGLCEGNHCEGSKGRGKERGNGRIVVTKLVEDAAGCRWETQKLVKLPAFFKDYSDMDIHEVSGRVVVASQEDAAVWVGKMNMTSFEIEGDGTVLHFPRSSDGCQAIYCNIEGVQFIDEYFSTSSCTRRWRLRHELQSCAMTVLEYAPTNMRYYVQFTDHDSLGQGQEGPAMAMCCERSKYAVTHLACM